MDDGGRPERHPDLIPRPRQIAMVLVFDLGGPLLAYSLLRSAGMSAVAALVISGVLPALGHRHRRNVTARAYTLIRCLAR